MRVWRCWPWRGTAPKRRRCGFVIFPRRTAIPERYLVQILLQLKGAGLVASTRGASGGYRLAPSRDDRSRWRNPDAVEGPETSLARPRTRRRPAGSVLESGLGDVRAAERAVLDQTTIAQLAEQCSPHEWVI